MKAIDEQATHTEAKRTWDSDPAVRDEFGSWEVFRAYRFAEARGQTKISGAPVRQVRDL